MQKWEYKLVSGWWLAENKLLEEINNLVLPISSKLISIKDKEIQSRLKR